MADKKKPKGSKKTPPTKKKDELSVDDLKKVSGGLRRGFKKPTN
jgi:hypothetical protein